MRVASELPEAAKATLETISTNDCKGRFHTCAMKWMEGMNKHDSDGENGMTGC